MPFWRPPLAAPSPAPSPSATADCSLVPVRAARPPAPGLPAGPSAGAARGGSRSRGEPRARPAHPGAALSRGAALGVRAAPRRGLQAAGEHGGRTRSGEKTRVKSGFVFPIPAILRWRTRSRLPAALRTRHHATLCRGGAAAGHCLRDCPRFLRGRCPHASVPRTRGHRRAHPQEMV